MRDENSKKSKVLFPFYNLFFVVLFFFDYWFWVFFEFSCVKLSWSKTLVRKWFNLKTKAKDFHADCTVTGTGISIFAINPLSLFIIKLTVISQWKKLSLFPPGLFVTARLQKNPLFWSNFWSLGFATIDGTCISKKKNAFNPLSLIKIQFLHNQYNIFIVDHLS